MDKDRIIALWEQHLGAELFAKDIDATMATMTGDPYVNHVPTMTGGVGAAELRRFYAHHFISRQPNDFEVVPVSRTWGRRRSSTRWSRVSRILVEWIISSRESLRHTGRSRSHW